MKLQLYNWRMASSQIANSNMNSPHMIWILTALADEYEA